MPDKKNDPLQNFIKRKKSSPTLKLVLIGFLLLSLTVPLIFVSVLNYDRKKYANQAKRDIGSKWGASQTVRGPYLVVPTVKKREVKTNITSGGSEKVETKVEITRKLAVFLPETLNVKSSVTTETRQRGIFPVPVYRSTLDFAGHFNKPDTSRIGRQVDEIIWDDATLVFMISDIKAIKKNIVIHINDGAIKEQFRAGTAHQSGRVSGIHVPLKAVTAKDEFNFKLKMHLNGSSSLRFAPSGGETTNTITSDWPHPSFQGAFLPDSRYIDGKGFKASWSIPRLARGQSQAFLAPYLHHFMGTAVFGVNFYQPTGFYNLIERSLKYAIGFIAIAFFAVFILEIQGKRPVHWVQYIFVGLALILFYLVLLGISEHTGFAKAYAISSLATVSLISLYAGSALRSFFRGGILFVILSFIYGLLFLLLRMEDYAMLIGSISAFALLAIVMFTTRNVNWSGAPKEEQEPATS